MIGENEIPKGTTHYFLWWNGLHLYKKEKGVWKNYSGGKWIDEIHCGYHKIGWFFGYRLYAGGYTHKLHKITYEV